MRHLLRSAAIAALVALPAAGQAADKPLLLDLRIDLYAAGLHAMAMDISARLDGERYRINANARTQGMADLIAQWRSDSSSAGVIEDGRVKPAWHRQDGRWRFNERLTRLYYDRDGDVKANITPPPDDDGREPVPPALRMGTLDVLSATLTGVVLRRTEDYCNRAVPIFDGRRRYDLRLSAVGEDLLPPSELSDFAGRALKCEVSVERVAGFKASRDDADDADDARRDERPPTYLWVAHLPDAGIVVPVRLEAASKYGKAVAHLTTVRTRRDDARQAAAGPR